MIRSGEPSSHPSAMSADGAVALYEVGPRDGIQRLEKFIPTDRKIRLITDLLEAGCRHIEVASFVSPKVTPQMADGPQILDRLPRRPGVCYSALVPNPVGMEAALRASVDRVCVGTATTDAFQQANMNATVPQTLDRIRKILAAGAGHPVRISGYVSCIVVCPYSGPVEPVRVAELSETLLELGCHDIFLGETLGRGTPPSVARVVDAVLERVPAGKLGMHLHDTYGQGLASLLPCLERGIRMIDSSVAGLGGCPHAPGAAGNVATEDVLYLLEGLGMAPDVDLERVAALGDAFCREWGLHNDSKAGRALSRLQQGVNP